MSTVRKEAYLRYTALALLLSLMSLTLAWELWLAPLRSSGSWLALKALPLAPMLRGIARGDTYTYQWATMLILAYVAEGVVRTYTERSESLWCAAAELALAAAFFTTAIAYARFARTQAPR